MSLLAHRRRLTPRSLGAAPRTLTPLQRRRSLAPRLVSTVTMVTMVSRAIVSRAIVCVYSAAAASRRACSSVRVRVRAGARARASPSASARARVWVGVHLVRAADGDTKLDEDRPVGPQA